MGQQQSSEKASTSRTSTPQNDRDRRVNRRPSVRAQSQGAAKPVDPSASHANAVAQGTSSHSVEKQNLQQMLQSTSPEYANKSTKVERSASRAAKEKKETESKAVPIPTRAAPVSVPEVPEVQETFPSGNIDIPAASASSRSRPEETEDDFRAYQERHYAPTTYLRPPRLPIPIAETRAPDSPTLQPINVSNADVPLFETDEPISAVEPTLRRKSSFQSEATQEEEEIGEELQPFAVEPAPAHALVPTVIEWNQPGERVFVTGTFATWDRKYRLHSRRDRDGMYTVINLPPGTHHLKFWVDHQMVTSEDLPTAVDFNNVLVNYIEISADDIPKDRERRESVLTQTGRSTGKSSTAPTANDQSNDLTNEIADTHTPGEEPESYDEPQYEEMPPGDFRPIVPQYLQDIDHDQSDPRYQQAVAVISDSNAPPSLPMFLNRSILNGHTPVKDDSSVLTLPNHTVLNHLMTSSVKNGVLATSVTTRYKKKYVTTISFKPVPKSTR